MWCLRRRRREDEQRSADSLSAGSGLTTRGQAVRAPPNMPLERSPERRLINRQRFSAMRMAAGLLFRRATGMKDGGAFVRREAGQFQFLERSGRHGGNLHPMLDVLGRQPTRFANFPVGGVVSELQREKFQRQLVKIFKVGADVRRLIIIPASAG